MLENLDQVAWERIGAKEVPEWLRALCSADRIKRNAAFKELEYYLVPWEAQELCAFGSEQLLELVSREAIIRTIPFLIELLGVEEIGDKELLLLLLTELLDFRNGEICLEEPQKDTYRSYVRLIHNVVYEVAAQYEHLVQSASPEIQMGARELTQSLNE